MAFMRHRENSAMQQLSNHAVKTVWPADSVERQIPGISEAEDYLRRHRPELLQTTRELNRELVTQFGAAIPDQPDMACQVSAVCLARVSLRHGSGTESGYAYHNETHSLEVLQQLCRIARQQPAGQSQPLDALACFCLAVFAAAHDMRQTETGHGADAVGCNERASADETDRILVALGLDQDTHQAIFQLLRWMIHGSTFFSKPMDFAGFSVPLGALAPVLAGQVLEQGRTVAELSAAQAAELILLATDIDTANVATPINQYARQSARICRELHQHRDLSGADPSVNRSVLAFLTAGQEHYFFNQQSFYSQLARQALNQHKRVTGQLLQQLIAWMRAHYAAQPPSGEVLLQAFLAQADRLSEQPAHQRRSAP